MLRAGWFLATRQAGRRVPADVVGGLARAARLLSPRSRVSRAGRTSVHVHARDFDAHYASAPRWERWLMRRTLGRRRARDRAFALVGGASALHRGMPYDVDSEPGRDTSRACDARLCRRRASSPWAGSARERIAHRSCRRSRARDPSSGARLVLAGDGDLASVAEEASASASATASTCRDGSARENARTRWRPPTISRFPRVRRVCRFRCSRRWPTASRLSSARSAGFPTYSRMDATVIFVPPDDPDALANRLECYSTTRGRLVAWDGRRTETRTSVTRPTSSQLR